MRLFPKRFERDRVLSTAHRELIPAVLGVGFAEHTQRPPQYLVQTGPNVLDPLSFHIGKKWSRHDLSGMLGQCYSPFRIAVAQHLLRGLHRGAGRLDIDHHVCRQLAPVSTKTTVNRRVTGQARSDHKSTDLADDAAQRSIPSTRPPVGPQCRGQLITRDGAITLEHQERKNDPALPSAEQPLINNDISRRHRHPTGELDPHRLEIDSLTDVVYHP